MKQIKRNIPGTLNIKNREFLYIADDGNDDFENCLFDKVTSQLDEPIAKSGGVISENCKLWLPTGELFHCLSYKGDLEGWRKEITQGAEILNLITGKINCDRFELSDKRTFKLKNCQVEFY